MGWFDDIGDAISDAADVVTDAVDDAGTWVADAADAVGGAIGDGLEGVAEGAGWFGGALGTAIDTVATTVDDASGGVFGSTLNFLDDTVFDSVDYLTDGLINVDFDNGTLSASLGIDGVMSVGTSIGEHGITADTSTLVASTDLGLTDQGLEAGASAGIDFGPLPYADGHIDLDADGTVSVDGHAQGVIPTPIGIVSGSVDGGFQRTPDGAWAGNISADGQLTLPEGTYVGAGFDLAHQQTADGDSITTVGAHGSLGQYGVGEVGVGGQYTHAEADGVTYDSVSGQATASGYGFEAGVEGSYDRTEAGGNVIEHGGVGGHVSGYGQGVEGSVNYTGGSVDGRDFSDWSATGSSNLDPNKLAAIGQSLFGDSGDGDGSGGGLPGSADDLVGMLGAGGTADLLGQLGGDELSGFVDSLGADGTQDFVNKLIGDGNLGSVLGGDGSAVQDLLGKVSQAGGLDDVLGQLDPGTTANLISSLASANAGAGAGAGGGAMGGGDDVSPPLQSDGLGAGPGAAPAPSDGGATDALGMPSGDFDPAGVDFGSAGVDDTPGLPDMTVPAAEGEDFSADPVAPAAVDVAPEPAPVPDDAFSQQIQGADQAEQSVDDMFDGLGS